MPRSKCPQPIAKAKLGNPDLRAELDLASAIRIPAVYVETLKHLADRFGHSILILPDGKDRISRFNCFAYGLGIWSHEAYIRCVGAHKNSAVLNSKLVGVMLKEGILEEINADQIKAGDVALYFNEGAITHAAIVDDKQFLRSKWGGNEVHRHMLGEVPAQYGNQVRFFKKPDEASLLSYLPDIT